ncbi:MAG: DUF4191 family protein [Salinibacterium sp.]|nr:MAG: DUF4191 family protein [Salinibacterium sp.]
MARTPTPTQKTKEPGRFKQLYQVFKITCQYNPATVWYLLGAFLGAVAAGVLLAVFVSGGSVFAFVVFIIIGVLGGALLVLIVLGRMAEKAVYSQIEGQQGAVGAVLKNVPRGWIASEMPVNVSAKTHDAVYRAVGRGGIALIGEGPRSRTQRMLEDERRAVTRILPNVPVKLLYVGPDEDSIPLRKLLTNLRTIKPALRKPEVVAVSNRLSSLSKGNLPIPKGIDPTKIRGQRPR